MTEPVHTAPAAHAPIDHTKRNKTLTIIAAIFLLIAIIYFFYWLCWGRFHIFTDDAYVNGNVVEVMSQVPGTVIAINTDETQLVLAGQPLVELDKASTRIALQKAKATLAQTVRQVRQYFENAERAQAVLVLRQANLTQAQLDFNRRTGLVKERAVSREEMQHTLTALVTAKSQYAIAAHNLRSALAMVENTHLYTHPLVVQAKANLKMAYLNYQRTILLAPVTGYVAKRSVQLGENVDTRVPLLAIVPLHQVWVDANYKETQIDNIRMGQSVTLTADAHPNVTYHGKIIGLTPGTGTAFALLPAQNATGNWIKILQRLPIRVGLDPQELKKYPLQIGLSMNVTTNVWDTSGHRLATAKEPPIRYRTPVYADQLRDVRQLIERILHKNSPDVFLSHPPSPLGTAHGR